MDPRIASALITFGSVIVAFVLRDIGIKLWNDRQKAKEKREARLKARRDIVRLYSDPLHEAARSLGYRLDEIIDKGPARYLLADSKETEFGTYKRISTLYRVAALLGWVRAFRRERSYLDPDEAQNPAAADDPIKLIEAALADGHHVEAQRLDELLQLWSIPEDKSINQDCRLRLAAKIDEARVAFLSSKGELSATELISIDKVALAKQCATIVEKTLNVAIPEDLVESSAERASVFLGIREAYLYRDWQAAIGDLMIVETTGTARRFDVMGFGEFEAQYVSSLKSESPFTRWFGRLETIFHDLDMSKTGIFDARREQLVRLQKGCKKLSAFLEEKSSSLASLGES